MLAQFVKMIFDKFDLRSAGWDWKRRCTRCWTARFGASCEEMGSFGMFSRTMGASKVTRITSACYNGGDAEWR